MTLSWLVASYLMLGAVSYRSVWALFAVSIGLFLACSISTLCDPTTIVGTLRRIFVPLAIVQLSYLLSVLLPDTLSGEDAGH